VKENLNMAKKASTSTEPKTKKKRQGSDRREIKQAQIVARRIVALDLKLQGGNYREIAEVMRESKIVGVTASYSEGLAYKDVQDALHELIEHQKELAAENLRLDLMRYDKMLSKVWEHAVPDADSRPPDVYAMNALLAILERRSTLLNYKAVTATPEQPNFNINVDWAQFTTAEIIEIRRRVSAGEDFVLVLTEVQQRPKESKAGGSTAN
jgi:hypothetical protein